VTNFFACFRFSPSVAYRAHAEQSKACLAHQYVCDPFDAEIRTRQSDRTKPGPVSLSADVLPLTLHLNIRPHQLFQYQMLQTAMKSQHRFDTMLRQRPLQRPMQNARAWWKYAIACVTARPNSRPWADIQFIVQCRTRYIELVFKKNASPTRCTGFHKGLSQSESVELLDLEDRLPIEALTAFHLLALRKAYAAQMSHEKGRDEKPLSNGDKLPRATPKSRSVSRTRRFRLLRNGNAASSKSQHVTTNDAAPGESENLGNQIVWWEGKDSLDGRNSISLLQAMTLRLGKKVWYVDWRIHDITAHVNFVRLHDEGHLALWTTSGNGSIRSFGKGKRDFAFNVTQFEVFHRRKKVLYILPVEHITVAESDDCSVETISVGFDSKSTSSSLSGDLLLNFPDLQSPSDFLEMPSFGNLCRFVGGKNLETVKISISSHPATLICTTSLFDGMSSFVSNGEIDVSSHIRAAATPLARKAQLALLSPVNFDFHLNIAAPKVWLPIVSSDTDGAMLLDAGTLKVTTSKVEGSSMASWDVFASEIKVNFVRGRNLDSYDSVNFHSLSQIGDRLGRSETAIVRPFNVSLRACESCPKARETMENDYYLPGIENALDIELQVNPVCVNLVDAEVIARAIGKWYARLLRSVRGRSSKRIFSEIDVFSPSNRKQVLTTKVAGIASSNSLPFFISMHWERFELVVEGHSKTQNNFADDRSMASLDSIHDMTPHTRTYFVEIQNIFIRHSLQYPLTMTRLSVADACILRLTDQNQYVPLRTKKDVLEPQYCILVRNLVQRKEAGAPSDILRATILHNGQTHLDEVEVDLDSIILRVTPTTLKDCAKAFKRLAELVQVMTKEMERKIHEEGRRSRTRDKLMSRKDESPINATSRPPSPGLSEAMTDLTVHERPSPLKAASDSSILIRVTVNDCTMLAGRPTMTLARNSAPTFAVLQFTSDALIMFQSIENPDGTGTTTLHVSVDNFCSLVNTQFARVSSLEAAPMMGPTGLELRIVYFTENMGFVVSQDVSIDFEAVKSCLTINDIAIIDTVSRKMWERMNAFRSESIMEVEPDAPRGHKPYLHSTLRYQKKGIGVATCIRIELQSFAFVLLRAYKSNSGAPEFIDFQIRELKGKFDGCISALSGELHTEVSMSFFNTDMTEWEFVVEPFPLKTIVDQMPNELNLSVSCENPVQINLTGILLRDLMETEFRVSNDKQEVETSESAIIAPSVLSTVGLRRATKAPEVRVKNSTGIDLIILGPRNEETNVPAGSNTCVLTALVNGGVDSACSTRLGLRIALSAESSLGSREPVLDLPIDSSVEQIFLLPQSSLSPSQVGINHVINLYNGRNSPDTVFTSEGVDRAPFGAEPVVEWCMHNQRLRSTTNDVFSLPKGTDVLSSIIWSPDEGLRIDLTESYEKCESEAAAGLQVGSSHERSRQKSQWQRPYLKNDSPEWTDMTCTMLMARERVLLPDSNWMWLNEWCVDVSGSLGKTTDADGWEYQADFETFSRERRYYQRGDTCRRRRWTRTRMVRRSTMYDPCRSVKVVWGSLKDDEGNIQIEARSHVRLNNVSGSSLTFFLFNPSWTADTKVETIRSDQSAHVPLDLADATYLRLAKRIGSLDDESLCAYAYTERIMFLPTSHNASSYMRTSISLGDVSNTTLHYVVHIECKHGMIDVSIYPVLKVINLLPCQLECQLGEVAISEKGGSSQSSKVSRRIKNAESLIVASGKEESCTALNPWSKPHISLRMPGYQWSPWQRIVNRSSNCNTWRPNSHDEQNQFDSRANAEFADEYKTVVHLERGTRIGDPLTVVLSVECGHCPTLRVYAQYWIIDKTGFGCRFTDGFVDIMNSIPETSTSRRSYLVKEEAREREIRKDLQLPGHQWSIGMSGMTLYFSKKERLSIAIETGVCESRALSRRQDFRGRSRWAAPLDVANVMPKTVFVLEEINGYRLFELAISVSVCPGVFGRTRMITLVPRYQIVNLLHRELFVAQVSCAEDKTVLPSQSTMPFHWTKGTLAHTICLGTPTGQVALSEGHYWSRGSFRLDRVGVTSIRLPTDASASGVPMVVQIEVRLASKDQSSAVFVVVWSANERTNPLYVLRNSTPFTVLCRQPLRDELSDAPLKPGGTAIQWGGCHSKTASSEFECGKDITPIIRSLFYFDSFEEYVWNIKSGDVVCFGFDDPDKPHVIEWTCADEENILFDDKQRKSCIELDCMGSSAVLTLANGVKIRCVVGAEHSAKLIEFFFVGCETTSMPRPPALRPSLVKAGEHDYRKRVMLSGSCTQDGSDAVEDDDTAFGVRIDVPLLLISVIDNADPNIEGREILFAQLDRLSFAFSQTREGYHEIELRLGGFQTDNHVKKSIHPVLVSLTL
jgi:hypothetical protein